MTQEEKAKKYDEALERATKELNTCGSLDCDAARQILRLFPQLRESEDERIRKELIEFIQWSIDRHFMRENFHQAKRPSEWIAYLEKQKEPHYTKRNALFDKCVENCDPEVMKEVSDYVDKMLEPKIAFGDWGDKEKKEAIITCLQYMRFIKKITNQEYDDLMNWLDSNLVSKEWSEEDEVYLQDALWCVKQAAKVAKDENDMGACWSAENWLKSLRPSWKPSEEQMRALAHAINLDVYDAKRYGLESLYNDLKKLM